MHRACGHQVRFPAPVLPGDTLTVDLWRDGPVVAFAAWVKARGVTMMNQRQEGVAGLMRQP